MGIKKLLTSMLEHDGKKSLQAQWPPNNFNSFYKIRIHLFKQDTRLDQLFIRLNLLLTAT